MGRQKREEAIKTNLIEEHIKKYKVSNMLLAIWTNVNYTQVSNWRSNVSQPSEENLNQLGELFERENALLKVSGQTRRNTGLAKALDQELKRLMKIEKIPFEVEVDKEVKKGEAKSESETGADDRQSKKSTKTINPLLVEKIKAFAEEYKKNNPPAPLTYFDKPLSKITKDELKGLELFICNAANKPSSVELAYQVLHSVEDQPQVIASFTTLTDVKNYVDLVQRGYIELSAEATCKSKSITNTK